MLPPRPGSGVRGGHIATTAAANGRFCCIRALLPRSLRLQLRLRTPSCAAAGAGLDRDPVRGRRSAAPARPGDRAIRRGPRGRQTRSGPTAGAARPRPNHDRGRPPQSRHAPNCDEPVNPGWADAKSDRDVQPGFRHHPRADADEACWPVSTDQPPPTRPTQATSGRLEHLRGSSFGCRNLTHSMPQSLWRPKDSDPDTSGLSRSTYVESRKNPLFACPVFRCWRRLRGS